MFGGGQTISCSCQLADNLTHSRPIIFNISWESYTGIIFSCWLLFCLYKCHSHCSHWNTLYWIHDVNWNICTDWNHYQAECGCKLGPWLAVCFTIWPKRGIFFNKIVHLTELSFSSSLTNISPQYNPEQGWPIYINWFKTLI